MKKCTICKIEKKKSEFYKSSKHKSGINNRCKICSDEITNNYLKTKVGLCKVIYKSQVNSSKLRGHKPPSYTKEELIKWIFLQPNFETLYSNWINSNYDKNLKPSINRLKDEENYNFLNIELITFQQNKEDQYLKSSKGIIGNKLRPITQLSVDGKKIKDYASINESVRETGLAQGNLWKVLNGIGQTLGGYKWKYND